MNSGSLVCPLGSVVPRCGVSLEPTALSRTEGMARQYGCSRGQRQSSKGQPREPAATNLLSLRGNLVFYLDHSVSI